MKHSKTTVTRMLVWRIDVCALDISVLNIPTALYGSSKALLIWKTIMKCSQKVKVFLTLTSMGAFNSAEVQQCRKRRENFRIICTQFLGVRNICPKSIGPMPTCPILTCPTWQLVLCQLAPHDILSYAVLSHT